MEHDATEHGVEGIVSELELLNHPCLKGDMQAPSCSFRAGAGHLFWPRVDAKDPSRRTNLLLGFECQCSSTTADIKDAVAWLDLGEQNSFSSKLLQLATKQERVTEPRHQVVPPAKIKNSPVGFGREG
jgi:hypothetical protein